MDGANSDHIIGITRDISYLGPVLLNENPEYKVRYYKNTRECLAALLEEDVDLVIQNSHRVSCLMQKPEFAQNLMEVVAIKMQQNIVVVAGIPGTNRNTH